MTFVLPSGWDFMYLQTRGNKASGTRTETEVSETGWGEGGNQISNTGKGWQTASQVTTSTVWFQYQLEKPLNEENDDEEEDDDYPRKQEELEEDPIEGIKLNLSCPQSWLAQCSQNQTKNELIMKISVKDFSFAPGKLFLLTSF